IPHHDYAQMAQLVWRESSRKFSSASFNKASRFLSFCIARKEFMHSGNLKSYFLQFFRNMSLIFVFNYVPFWLHSSLSNLGSGSVLVLLKSTHLGSVSVPVRNQIFCSGSAPFKSI